MSNKAIQKTRNAIPAAKLGGGKTVAQPSIVFSNPERDERYVSGWTLAVLETCMARAGVKRVLITSTYRSPHDQARVMRSLGPVGTSMYAGHGLRVMTVARNIALADQAGTILSEAIGKLPNVKPAAHKVHSNDEIIVKMAAEIEKLEHLHGQGCVSRHQVDPVRLNVVDIASNSVHPKSVLEAFITTLTASTRVGRIGLPKGRTPTHSKHFRETQPCIHVEIPQLNDALTGRFSDTA